MTHIATHPPSFEDSYISASPLYQMLGYLNLATDDGKPAEDFKLFFINNSGYKFEKDSRKKYKKKRVGCHLALFPLSEELKKSLKGKSYCAIAYDLADYELHAEAEREVMANDGKIENARIEFIEDYVASGLPGSPTEKTRKKRILEQTTGYMRTQAFRITYPYYKTGINTWIRKNVATLEQTEGKIFGCSDFSQGNTILMRDFQKFLGAKPRPSSKR